MRCKARKSRGYDRSYHSVADGRCKREEVYGEAGPTVPAHLRLCRWIPQWDLRLQHSAHSLIRSNLGRYCSLGSNPAAG